MSEKSGLEMLEEILHRLDRIEQQLKVQDNNIKAIANTVKIAELINKAAGTPLDGWARANKATAQAVDINEELKKSKERIENKVRFNFQPSDAAKIRTNEAKPARRGARATAAEPPAAKPKTVMCKGKMLVEDTAGKMVPLAGLSVKVYDSKDNLVKETKTNRAGHWMSQFPPGQYVVCYEGDYKGQKLVPVNKNFTVPKELAEGQSFVEVN